MSIDLDTGVVSVTYHPLPQPGYRLFRSKFEKEQQCTESEILICQVLLDEDPPNGGLLEEGDVGLIS